MKCPGCGKEIDEGVKFCPECGIAIKKADRSKEKTITPDATLKPGFMGKEGERTLFVIFRLALIRAPRKTKMNITVA